MAATAAIRCGVRAVLTAARPAKAALLEMVWAVCRAGSSPRAPAIDRDTYQAVFLTNGSTYFGKLEAQGDEWFLLSDVFYLSVSEQSGPQLIKRGTEAQGPKSPMIISREQVLFIENLRDDGDIVTLIKKFKSGQLPTATAPPSTPSPTLRPSSTPSPTR